MPDQDWVQLAQVRPTDTANLLLFVPVRGHRYRCKVIVANVDGSASTYRVFHDDDGTTYSEATALAWDRSCGAGIVDEIPETGEIYMDNAAGAIAVRSSTGSALTFTLYGIREKK